MVKHRGAAAHPDGYPCTQFCAYYDRWLATIDPEVREVFPVST